MRGANALASLHVCADSLEYSLIADTICIEISCTNLIIVSPVTFTSLSVYNRSMCLPGATQGVAVLQASDPVEVHVRPPPVVHVTVRVLVPPGRQLAEHVLQAP